MATVKLNAGGKVLTKGGKVSCGCCGVPPAECCMYPAQALADGYYSADDLPDEITIIACGVPGTTGTVQSFLTKSGSSYSGSPYNTTIRLITDLDGISTWLTGIENELLTTDRDCLVTILQSQAGEVICGPTTANIQNADNFADTYTVAYAIGDDNTGSMTITRQSLCVWTGNAGGVPIRLEYDGTDFFRWFMITPETEIAKEEPSFENTPTGFYQTGNTEFTVS